MVTALAWTQERLDPPNDNRIAAVLRCGNKGCTSKQAIPLGSLGSAPEYVRKLFERKGWSVDQHNQARCRCPNCQKIRQAVAAPVGRPVSLPPKPEERTSVTTATIGRPQLIDIKSIPAAVKTRIRQKLDAHFDDSAGAYLNGQTDQQIAKELNVPVAQVFSLRETAYGPLKRDPEVDELLAMLAALNKKQADLQSDMAKLDLKAATILKRLGL